MVEIIKDCTFRLILFIPLHADLTLIMTNQPLSVTMQLETLFCRVKEYDHVSLGNEH